AAGAADLVPLGGCAGIDLGQLVRGQVGGSVAVLGDRGVGDAVEGLRDERQAGRVGGLLRARRTGEIDAVVALGRRVLDVGGKVRDARRGAIGPQDLRAALLGRDVAVHAERVGRVPGVQLRLARVGLVPLGRQRVGQRLGGLSANRNDRTGRR